MAAQSLKKTCNLLIVTALITMMFSAQISHSNNVDMCINLKCVPNQCMKVVKNGTPVICEEMCKKYCLEGPVKVDYIVPPGDHTYLRRLCRYLV
ncbi:unnamed protein product [Arabidopsis lyrata]|uniref:Plant thionin family protein n=1 Tax=Arabidopsis lyrata subsp. lyrata TaxID=81972 RepID=D7KKX2_ARALL|nr:hypothetical protein ARALYDRAFT_889679 [Arabidopsis lyrata subsp. lyrata]CAH8253148.1 unnamed protein product [Arabidopsis lyrata]